MSGDTVSRLPLVSIVTPAFNAAKYLEQLIVSVEAQTYPRIEHIIIDDGSTDEGDTCAVLSRHPNVKWWSRENRGQYATVNEGFAAATGELVMTISADDFFVDAQTIEDVIDHYLTHGACQVVHGYTLHVDARGVALPVQPYQDFPYWMIPFNPGFISHCSLFVRRDLLLADGLLFDSSLRFTGDGDWLIRLYLAGYRHCRVKRLVGAYRHHDLQVSRLTDLDRSVAVERRAERDSVDRRYVRSQIMKLVASAYAAYRLRLGKAKWALRSGGVSGLTSLVRTWWSSRVSGE